MRRFLVTLILTGAPMATASAQFIKTVDVGVTGGSARDYYGFEFGPKWQQFLGARVDAGLWAPRWGVAGVSAQVDRYSYNSLENYAGCPACTGDGAGNNYSRSVVGRISGGPFATRTIASYDLTAGLQLGWAKRTYPDSRNLRGFLEDESGHAFYSAELGAGVHFHAVRVGARVEYGSMQRVRNAPTGACGPTVDLLPGSSIDCSSTYGARSFSRIGLSASYQLRRR